MNGTHVGNLEMLHSLLCTDRDLVNSLAATHLTSTSVLEPKAIRLPPPDLTDALTYFLPPHWGPFAMPLLIPIP